MDKVQIGRKNWHDGARIATYCGGRYSAEDILALQHVHRLSLHASYDQPARSIEAQLSDFDQMSGLQKIVVRAVCMLAPKGTYDAMVRLASDPQYAQRMRSIYAAEIKPRLDL